MTEVVNTGNFRRSVVVLASALWSAVAAPSVAQDAIALAPIARPGDRGRNELASCGDWWRLRKPALPRDRRALADPSAGLRPACGFVDAVPRPDFGAIAAVARRGDAAAVPALLLLGLTEDAAATGWLESVLQDDVVGRRLVGANPVPADLRAAAALALGLSRRPHAYGSLRAYRAAAGALEPDLAAATALALALADDSRDDEDFLSYLSDGRGTPAAREATAAAFLLRGRPTTGRRCADARTWLSVEPSGAGRGVAAAAYWRRDAADDESLHEAAARSPDAVTRAHALLALAVRGDARVLDAVPPLFSGTDIERGYGVVALAVRARAASADPVESTKARDAFAAGAAECPAAALVGEDVLVKTGRGDLPPSTSASDVRRLVASHAGLYGAPALAAVLARLAAAALP